VVERAVILSRGGPLAFQTEGGRPAKNAAAKLTESAGFYTEAQWQEMERQNLLKALKSAGGKVSGRGGAAELLGVNSNTLASRLRALGISRSFGG
jgi:transcriptional regulator with GAF, ATPase, and Fis domain